MNRAPSRYNIPVVPVLLRKARGTVSPVRKSSVFGEHVAHPPGVINHSPDPHAPFLSNCGRQRPSLIGCEPDLCLLYEPIKKRWKRPQKRARHGQPGEI